jgi:hypothetical protein
MKVKIATLLLCLATITISAQVDRPVRTLQKAPGLSISRSAVGDRPIVIVNRDDGPDYVVPSRQDSAAAFWVGTHVAAIEYEVTRVNSSITANDDWVTSQVVGIVTDVFKEPTRASLRVGQVISFHADGGQVTVNSVPVTAVVEGVKPFREAARYVSFLSWDERNAAFWVSPVATYEVTATGLRSIMPTFATKYDDLEGQDSAAAAVRIRRAVAADRK